MWKENRKNYSQKGEKQRDEKELGKTGLEEKREGRNRKVNEPNKENSSTTISKLSIFHNKNNGQTDLKQNKVFIRDMKEREPQDYAVK